MSEIIINNSFSGMEKLVYKTFVSDLYPPLPNRRIKDMRGKKYGGLYCVAFEDVIDGHAHWKFVCDCGEVTVRSGASVKNANHPTCGCRGWTGGMTETENGVRIPNLKGFRFGNLVAVELLSARRRGNAVWKCLCDCGNTTEVCATYLINHKTTGCGCRNGNPKDISGKRFGKLIAKYPTMERSDRQVVWFCECDCGNTTRMSQAHLTRGQVKSCGCEHTAKDYEGMKENEKNALQFMRLSIRSSKKRKLDWKLSLKEVMTLIYSDCYYCGSSPTLDANGTIRNGIDRVDNRIGYLFDNCVSCCTSCNLAKRTLSVGDFLHLVEKIALNHNLAHDNGRNQTES